MAYFQSWDGGVSPQSLGRALFEGRLVVFENLPAVGKLTRRARTILSDVFATDDPPAAENRLSAPAFRRLALEARKVIGRDETIARQWRDTLASIGYLPEDTWLDRIRLRAVPSRDDIDHPRLEALPPHRDTWGSGIGAQVNWWLRLYPLSDTRTMLLWPATFRHPVANDSADWSFDAFRRGRAGRGAPNVDCAATAEMWRWYSPPGGGSDGEPT